MNDSLGDCSKDIADYRMECAVGATPVLLGIYAKSDNEWASAADTLGAQLGDELWIGRPQ